MIEATATRLWDREVHGTGGQHPMFDPAGTALYYSDGWGRRPAPSLRFRRVDIQSGAETAGWPCGSAVRCLVRLDDRDLLLATDQRLVRLDATTLDERARWDPSVRHATGLAVQAGVAIAGDPVTPTTTFVDLETGRVRRRRTGPSAAIIGRRRGQPIVVGGSGGLGAADGASATIHPVRSTPPVMAAALDEAEEGVWVIAGTRVEMRYHDGGASLRPGAAAIEIDWFPLGPGSARTLQAPEPVRTIDVGHGTLWLTPAAIPGTAQYVLIGSPRGDEWRIWHPPERTLVEAVAPRSGLVVTSTHEAGSATTVLSCHRIEG